MRFYKVLLLGGGLLLSAQAWSQTLGDFKPSDESYGTNKLKKVDNKSIYIAGFNVHYQLYNEKQNFKQGGSRIGGGYTGDATAEASVGLDGIDEKTLQEITDKLYQDYISKLKSKGLKLISADEAAKSEAYEDFEMVKGGSISTAEIPGAISTTPTGYSYMIKGLSKKGKAKKGGFLGNEQFKFPNLSKDLNDALIGNVNITVLFVKDGQTFSGNGAKVKIKTDLRIVSTDAVSMTSEASIKLKGQNSTTPVSSTVAFYQGKSGLASVISYVGSLKKDFEINDAVDEKKIVSYAKGSTDAVGASNAYATYYSVSDASTETTKVIPVDATKYGKGVYEAAAKFLNYHTDEFLSNL